MDIVMEIVFEVLMEGYIWLMQLIVPGAGEGAKGSRNIATVLSLIGIVVVIGAFIAGLVLMDMDPQLGSVFLIVAGVVSAIQIGAGIFACVIRRKRAAKRADRA